MELFRDTCFDFLGRKWWFILPSLILTFAGLVSLLINGGPKYSIDFKGGALMDVRWEGTPPVEQIREAVSSRLTGVSVVAAHDLTGQICYKLPRKQHVLRIFVSVSSWVTFEPRPRR